MAKKGGSSYMTTLEQGFGGILLILYLVVLPFVTAPMFQGLETLLGFQLTDHMESVIYYYALFALTLGVFWNYIGRTTKLFISSPLPALQTALMGLVGFYGLNELSYRVLKLVTGGYANLNDMTISAQVNDAPRNTFFIIVLLAPFVEEVLFRGYVFGNIRNKSRAAAYIISCALFAALHVWQFAAVEQSIGNFLLMLQYFVPGIVFAWCYEQSGTLWTGIIAHAFVNALAMWSIT